MHFVPLLYSKNTPMQMQSQHSHRFFSKELDFFKTPKGAKIKKQPCNSIWYTDGAAEDTRKSKQIAASTPLGLLDFEFRKVVYKVNVK